MVQSVNIQSGVDSATALIKTKSFNISKSFNVWIVILLIPVLFPNQVFSATLTNAELGEQVGLYLAPAYVFKSISQEQCVDVAKIPGKYQEAENFVYKQLIRMNFSNKDASSIINNHELQAFFNSHMSTYVKMLNQMETYYSHSVACGYVLGVLQGIKQASSRVIENAEITRNR